MRDTGRIGEKEEKDGKNPLVGHGYGVPLIGLENKKRTPNRFWLEVQDAMKIID